MSDKYKHCYAINNPGKDWLEAHRADMPTFFDTVYNAAVLDIIEYLDANHLCNTSCRIEDHFLIKEEQKDE